MVVEKDICLEFICFVIRSFVFKCSGDTRAYVCFMIVVSIFTHLMAQFSNPEYSSCSWTSGGGTEDATTYGEITRNGK